ncbi:MAG: heat-inducible transcription repressor HrcA [Chloroflexi bacterium]|nr:heat-inducible transcription repressor HrcA [Chloroflexota bacterium]
MSLAWGPRKSAAKQTQPPVLTKRQEKILRFVILDYVQTASPVASEGIVHRHGLAISSATVRNEMAALEEIGFLAAPHTSAGRIPSEKGYRYYVEWLMEEVELPASEQNMIRHQFHQSKMDMEEWTRLSAAILSRMVSNLGLVTLPKLVQCRLKHLRLVALQENLALLILVLQEAKVKQRVLDFGEAVSQEELDIISLRLTNLYKGLTSDQISDAPPAPRQGSEERLRQAIAEMMKAEDDKQYPEPHVDGLRLLLLQPEFASNVRIRGIVEALESKALWHAILPQVLTGEGIRVVIGNESPDTPIRDCSVVLARYGIPGEVEGALGVLGPTRMAYARTVSTVRYLSSLMRELIVELSG